MKLTTRLCMTVTTEEAWCPLRHAVLGSKGYHAGMCCAGGERTARHNVLRNIVFCLAAPAALSPELEKIGFQRPLKTPLPTNADPLTSTCQPGSAAPLLHSTLLPRHPSGMML